MKSILRWAFSLKYYPIHKQWKTQRLQGREETFGQDFGKLNWVSNRVVKAEILHLESKSNNGSVRINEEIRKEGKMTKQRCPMWDSAKDPLHQRKITYWSIVSYLLWSCRNQMIPSLAPKEQTQLVPGLFTPAAMGWSLWVMKKNFPRFSRHVQGEFGCV